MAKRGRPRNPDCDGCGGPTNYAYDYIDGNGDACKRFECRRSPNYCDGALRSYDEINGYW